MSRKSALTQRLSKTLRLESLEDRQAMAGDITAYVSSDGNLNILERSGHLGTNQAVHISTLANGQVRLTGASAGSGPNTTIDGAVTRDFTVSGGIVLNLGGGNDYVRLVQNSTFRAVTLNMGTEDANVVNDNDQINIEKINTSEGMNITTGKGADYISLIDSQIGDGYFDNLIVNMGSGADNFYLRGANQTVNVKGNFNLYMFNASAEQDQDVITLDNASFWQNHVSSTGGGNDLVTMKNVATGGDLLLSMGDGQDTAKVTSVQAYDDFFAYMGEGDDSLELTDVGADEMWLNGEGGTDTLNRYSPRYVRTISQSGFERGNAAPILFEPVRK